MKKRLIVTGCIIVISTLLIASCGVKQEDYDSLNSSYESVQSENDALQSELTACKNDNEELQNELNELKEEYDAYKESMSEYEDLSKAEAEAREIEAKQIAEAEKEAQEKAEREANEKAEAEEKMGYDTGITYDQLARTPDDYEGKKVKFKGKVIQVIEGDDEIQIRLAVNSNYDTVIYCGYDPSIVKSRVLEDDIITIYGMSVGLISYESSLSGTITIPAVYVDKIDQ